MKKSSILPIRYKDCEITADGNLIFWEAKFDLDFKPFIKYGFYYKLELNLETGVLKHYDENDQCLEQINVKLVTA